MTARVGLVFLTVALAILGTNEAALTRHNDKQTLTYYPQRTDFYNRQLQISHPNPFLRQKKGMPRMQNFPQEWPYNQHQVQALPRIEINPTRAHSLPPARPYNRQKIQAPPSNTHKDQQKQVKNYERPNQSDEPKNQVSTVRHSTTKQNTKRGILPLTRNNYKYPANQSIKPSFTNLQAGKKVHKQWVLPRTSLWASHTSLLNTRRRSRQRGLSNSTQQSCPNGKIWRSGVCVCPYLSNWDEIKGKCVCIYGTYKDSFGNCRNF